MSPMYSPLHAKKCEWGDDCPIEGFHSHNETPLGTGMTEQEWEAFKTDHLGDPEPTDGVIVEHISADEYTPCTCWSADCSLGWCPNDDCPCDLDAHKREAEPEQEDPWEYEGNEDSVCDLTYCPLEGMHPATDHKIDPQAEDDGESPITLTDGEWETLDDCMFRLRHVMKRLEGIQSVKVLTGPLDEMIDQVDDLLERAFAGLDEWFNKANANETEAVYSTPAAKPAFLAVNPHKDQGIPVPKVKSEPHGARPTHAEDGRPFCASCGGVCVWGYHGAWGLGWECSDCKRIWYSNQHKSYEPPAPDTKKVEEPCKHNRVRVGAAQVQCLNCDEVMTWEEKLRAG